MPRGIEPLHLTRHTSVRFNADLHIFIQARAREQGCSMSYKLMEICYQYMRVWQEKNKGARKHTFDVTDADLASPEALIESLREQLKEKKE